MTNEPEEGDTIAVWFSCGAASAVAALKTIHKYGNFCNVRIINNPVFDEHPDNFRFLKDVEKWLGYKIEFATNRDYPNANVAEVFEKENYMSSPEGAVCTRLLKKAARQQWEERNHHDWLVMGFTSEEKHRHHNFSLSERDTILPILIDLGLNKQDCFEIISEAGLKLPQIYSEKSRFGDGYPNANCIGCVKATSPTYWNHVRETFPEVFKKRAEQSRRMGKQGCRLVRYKGKRIFLDELPEDARGHSLKTLKMPECGIFCTPEKIFKKGET